MEDKQITSSSAIEGSQSTSVSNATPVASTPRTARVSRLASRGFIRLVIIVVLSILVLAGSLYIYLTRNERQITTASTAQPASSYDIQNIPLGSLGDGSAFGLNTSQSLSINGQLRANNTIVLSPTQQPGTGVAGQVYYDSELGRLAYFDGSRFTALAGVDQVASLQASLQSLQGQLGQLQIPQLPADLALLGELNNFSALNTFSGGLAASSLNVSGSVSLGPTTVSSLILSNPLSVGSGGTGQVSLPLNGVLIGQGGSPVGSVSTATSGFCLMSTAGAPSFQPCPGGAGGVNSFNGLTGAVTLANSSAGGSTVTINDASTAAKGIAQFNASNFSVSGGTVNTIQDISVSATPTFAGLSTAGTVTAGSFSGNGSALTNVNADQLSGQTAAFYLNAANLNTGTLSDARLSVNVAKYNDATANFTGNLQENGNDVCTTAGNCAGMGVGGSGTAGVIAVWNGTGFTIGDSLLTQDTTAGTVTVAGSVIATGFTGDGSGLTNVNAATLQGQAGTYYLDLGNATGTLNVARIADASLTNAKLANSSLTVTAGNGLVNGGAVALGGATTLNVGAGDGISVTADAIAVDSTVCRTSGNCLGSGGAVSGSGTAGTIAVWNGTGFSLTDSIITQTGTTDITVGGNLTATNVSGNGSGLTTLNASNVSTGTLGDARLSTNVTLQGNTFNGNNQLVQLNASGQLPALNGSLLTNLNASSISSGTLGDARLSANVALLNTAANFTSMLQQGGNDVCTTAGNCVGSGGSGAVGGSGTAGTIAVWTGSGFTIGDSLLSQSSGTVLLSGTGTGTISTAGINQTLTLQGNGTGGVTVLVPTFKNANGATYTFDAADAGAVNATICTTAGNCLGSGGGVSGSGTAGTIAVWNGTGFTLGDSLLSESAGVVTVAGDLAATNLQGNGSGITDLNASNINTGTLADVRLSANVTLAGNTFNGANQLVQLNASGQLPALNGSLLTSLNASNIANGTLGDARLSANVALYGAATANFTGVLQQGGNNVCTTAGNCAGGATTVGALDGGTANANGATISGTTFYLQSASSINPGLVNTGAQTFAGNKTFTGTLSVQDVTLAANTSITVTGGATGTRPASPAEGMVYYDTTTKQLLVYANGKWQADRSSNTKIVGMGAVTGCTGSAPVASQSPDNADYVVTSCTSAQTTINSAITALPSDGGTVYLMEGTYIIDGNILPNNNVTIAGAGKSTIIKFKDSTATNTFGIYAISKNRLVIRDLKIDGNKANNAGLAQDGIYMGSVGSGSGATAIPGVSVEAVEIVNTARYGIYMNGAVNSSVSGTSVIASANRGIHMTTMTNNVISNNTVQGNGSDGVYVGGGTGGNIAGNIVEGNTGNGISIGSGTRIAITGNSIKSNTDAGIQAASSGSSITGNTIASNGTRGIYLAGSEYVVSGNTIVSNTSDGIYLQTSSDNNISGNSITSNGGNGIYAWNGNNRNSITSNTLRNNGGTGSSHGIYINLSSNYNTIADNHITDTAGTGVAINIPGSVDYTTLSNNTYSGTGAASITDSSATTIYNNQTDANGNIINRGTNGLAVGALSASSTLTVQGGYVGQALLSPAQPTGATQGTAGTTSYSYVVTALDGVGETLPSTVRTITTGNATLNVTNFNRISWVRVSGAVSYNVYRTASAGTPGTTGLIGTVAANATNLRLDDTGLAASGSVPVSNTTGGISVASNIQGSNATLTGGTLTVGTASVAGSLVVSDGSSNTATISVGNLAGNYVYSIPVTTANDTFCLLTLANCSGGAVSTIGALDGGTPSANGASISGSTLYLQSASGTNPGLVNTTTQTFAGDKTFVGSGLYKNTSDSVAAFQIQNATSSSIFNVDTTNTRISIGAVGGFSDTPSKLPDPATTPTGDGYGTAFSPDGQYMSVAHATTPFVTIYKRSGDTFTKLANPATLPTGLGVGTAFSPDGQYLTITHANAPFVTIYKRSGDTFTKLADPATLPTGTGQSPAFSPDGQYMSIPHATSPFITIYKRSGDTFTKLADPAVLPTGTGKGTSFSPDGQYLSIAHDVSPFVTLYKRSGDTFTKLANPATLPTGTGSGTSFSPDGQYVSVAHATTPFVTIYKRSGDTFTKLANPATLPAGVGNGTAFSLDGQYMSVAHNTSPFITIYKRSGDTFTKLANPATLPGGIGYSTAFSPDGQYMSVGSAIAAPYLTIYKGTGGAAARMELASGTTAEEGLAFGKELKVYRSAPGILSLGAGGSLSLEGGNLSVQGGAYFASNVGIGAINTGNLLSVGALTTADTAGQLAVSTGTAGGKGIVVQGVASQTGDLLQAQSSTGTVLARIDASGNITSQNLTVEAGKTLTLTGGTTGTRPASPTEGMVYYDTTTKSLLQYNGTKWVSDRNAATKTVAANNSSQAAKDAADYVATGTGDQSQINSALTAAAGGTVYLMEGTYYLSAQISVPNNTTLMGAGAGTLVTLPNAQNGSYTMIANSDTSTGTGVTIRNLQIDGNRANQTSGNMTAAISFSGMGAGSGSTAREGSKIQDTIIKNIRQGRGIVMNGSNNTISNNTFQYNEIQGINMNGSYNVISNNRFLGNQNYTINVAGSNHSITGNVIEGGGAYGIMLTATYSTISGNTITTSASSAIYFTGVHATITGNNLNTNTGPGVEVRAEYATVTGNTVSGNSDNGIQVHSNYANVSSNNVNNNTQDGILIYSDSNSISGNRIHNNGSDGIHLFGPSDNNSITGNYITDTAGSSDAINLDAFGGTPTGNYLTNNHFSGTGATTINDEGSGTIYSNQKDSNGNIINRTQGGGFTVGTTTAAASFTLQGGMVTGQLSTPTLSATVTNVGTAGSTTYRYQVTATDGTGETVGSTIQQTTTGNATLNGTNYNTITWVAVPGAYQYNIYKCTGAACTPLKKTTVAGNTTSFNDQSAGSPVGAAPVSNTTGGANFAGSIQGSNATFTGGTLTVGNSTTQGSLVVNDGSSNTATIQVGNLAGNYIYTIPVTAANDTFCMLTLANCNDGGVTTVGALDGGTANADGATITASTIYLQSASGTNPGLVNTVAQTFAGNKTFNGALSTTGNVAIGTASASTTLHVRTNNATVNQPQILVEQAGTGDSSMEFKDASGKSFYVGMDASSGSTFKISSSTAAQSSVKVGNTAISSSQDPNLGGAIKAKKVTTGAQGGTLSSITIYVGSVDTADPGVKVAVYDHDAGNNRPGNLIAGTTTSQTLATGWNTIPISGSVSASTTYWIAIKGEGVSEFMYTFCPGCAGETTYYNGQAFGNAWPTPAGAPTSISTNENYSWYMSVVYGGIVDTYDGTDLLTLSDSGALTLQNSSDSTGALTIKNAAGTNIVRIDTNDAGSINLGQIGSATNVTGTLEVTGTDASAFVVQNGSSDVLFKADTSTQTITVGTTINSTGARLHIEGQTNTLGTAWISRNTPTTSDGGQSITYGNGTFVAVMNSGTNRVMTSPDGVTWTPRVAAEANAWQSVTYGNGTFVAVASSGTNRVMTSSDGITWTAQAAAAANIWQSVTYGNNLFVAVSDDGANQVMTSPDGVTWTAQTQASTRSWESVTYGNNLFVAVSDNSTGTTRVMTSPDGVTWTTQTSIGSPWQGVTYGNGLFVAVAELAGDRVMTSPDGVTWTAQTAAESNNWQSVTYGNGLFVAVATSGTNRVMTSPDGVTWTAQAASAANNWRSVAYGNGLFAAVSSSGTSTIMTSGDIALSTRGDIQVAGEIYSNTSVRTGGTVQAAELQVISDSPQGYVATISNTSTSTDADGLLIKLGVANSSRTTSNYFVGFATANGTVAGKIQGGASAVAYTTTGADYAEWFKADPAKLPQPGELVALDMATPGGVRLASESDSFVGIVSTNPGFVGNGPLCSVNDENCDAEYAKTNVLVALVGQVPLKTNNEGGDIQVGDAVGASSTPGVATKVTTGSVIGYALSAPDADGMIRLLIRPKAEASTQNLQGGSLTISGSTVLSGGVSIGGDLNVTGAVKLSTLEVTGSVAIGGNLKVAGTLEVPNIIVLDHMQSQSKAPQIAVGSSAGSGGIAVIDGTDVAGTITVTVTAAQNEALNAGELAEIVFNKRYDTTPRIVISPLNQASVDAPVYLVKTSTGYKLMLSRPAQNGVQYQFDYVIIGSKTLSQ